MRMPATRPIDLAVWLDQVVGPMWRAYPAGSLPGLPGGVELVARFVDDDAGRRVLAGVLVLGEAITSPQLRSIPVPALENSANAGTDARRAVRKLPPLERGGLSPEDFSRRVAGPAAPHRSHRGRGHREGPPAGGPTRRRQGRPARPGTDGRRVDGHLSGHHLHAAGRLGEDGAAHAGRLPVQDPAVDRAAAR